MAERKRLLELRQWKRALQMKQNMKEGPMLGSLDAKERRSKTELGSIPPDSGSDGLDEPAISDVSTPPRNKRRSVYTDGE